MKPSEMTMGERFKKLRNESEKGKNGKRPTTLEVARASGVSEGVINGIETGKQTNPSSKNLAALADYYGVSCDYLLGKTDVEDRNAVAQYVNARYGLSGKSLKALEWFVICQQAYVDDGEKDYYGAINTLLSSAKFRDLIFHIIETKECHEYASLHPLRTYTKNNIEYTVSGIIHRVSDIEKKVVYLEAKDAARYHSQEAAQLLQGIITAYCKKPKAQQKKKKEEDNDNG